MKNLLIDLPPFVANARPVYDEPVDDWATQRIYAQAIRATEVAENAIHAAQYLQTHNSSYCGYQDSTTKGSFIAEVHKFLLKAALGVAAGYLLAVALAPYLFI